MSDIVALSPVTLIAVPLPPVTAMFSIVAPEALISIPVPSLSVKLTPEIVTLLPVTEIAVPFEPVNTTFSIVTPSPVTLNIVEVPFASIV